MMPGSPENALKVERQRVRGNLRIMRDYLEFCETLDLEPVFNQGETPVDLKADLDKVGLTASGNLKRGKGALKVMEQN